MTVSVTDSPSAIPALMRVRDRRAIFNPQAPGRCPAGRMRGSCLRRSPHASSGSVAGCGQVLLEPDGDPEELTPKIDPPDLNPTPGGTPRMSSRRGASVPAAGHLSRRPPRLRVLKRLGRLDGLLRLNLLAPPGGGAPLASNVRGGTGCPWGGGRGSRRAATTAAGSSGIRWRSWHAAGTRPTTMRGCVGGSGAGNRPGRRDQPSLG